MLSVARLTATRFASRTLVQSSIRPVAAPLLVFRPFAGGADAPTFLPPDEVTERILTVVKNFDRVDPDKVMAESKFSDDLGLDSLDAVELVMAIEDEFAVEIPDAEADKIASIADAVEYVSGHPMAK